MNRLAVLEEPRTFPPNRLLFVVWGMTLLISLLGLFAVSNTARSLLFWVVIAATAFWQVWVTRWVRVDQEGITVRNIFRRGRQLRWEEITEFREEELPLQKRSYVTLHLSNQGTGDSGITKIHISNDQVGFESLRTIVREAVPKPPQKPTDELMQV